jgi:hypothetical protein
MLPGSALSSWIFHTGNSRRLVIAAVASCAQEAWPDRCSTVHPRLLSWQTGQRLSYSIGFTLPTDFAPLLDKVPERVWTPAYDGDGQVRDGTWVAEVIRPARPDL